MVAGSTYLISGADLSADDLRSLRHWMLEVRDLSGPVGLRQRAPQPGELGSMTDALVVAVGSGGALTALTGALISWLRHRTTDLTVTVIRPDGGAVEVDGRRLRGVDPAQLSAMIERLTAQLADPPAAADTAPPRAADQA